MTRRELRRKKVKKTFVIFRFGWLKFINSILYEESKVSLVTQRKYSILYAWIDCHRRSSWNIVSLSMLIGKFLGRLYWYCCLTLSNRYSVNSILSLEFCVALCYTIIIYLKVICQKWRKFVFRFLVIIIFLLMRILPWNLVWCLVMLLTCLMQNMKNIYRSNSNLCKLFLHMRPENWGTHRSQQVRKG